MAHPVHECEMKLPGVTHTCFKLKIIKATRSLSQLFVGICTTSTNLPFDHPFFPGQLHAIYPLPFLWICPNHPSLDWKKKKVIISFDDYWFLQLQLDGWGTVRCFSRQNGPKSLRNVTEGALFCPPTFAVIESCLNFSPTLECIMKHCFFFFFQLRKKTPKKTRNMLHAVCHCTHVDDTFMDLSWFRSHN